jgi:hypothetical protein
MTNAANFLRTLLVYAVALPLALVVGYQIATPGDLMTWALMILVLGTLCIPLILKWHTPLLFMSWNMSAVLFFLPGQPNLWFVMAFASLLVAVVERTLVRERRFLHVPSVVLPVVFLVAVVAMTAKLTGGFGLRALGSENIGGKAYFWTFGAAAGLFAMTARAIPLQKARLYLGLFFLAALSNGIGNLTNFVPSWMYYMFWVFPVETMPGQEHIGIARYSVLGMGLLGVFWYILARYGVSGLLGGRNLRRLLLLLFVFVLVLGGGYRSNLILTGMTLTFVFLLEGAFRLKQGQMLLAGIVGACLIILPVTDKLPLPIQRSLSVLPMLKIDPVARLEAQQSSEWRIEMWKRVLPDVPKYFWLGKGYAVSGMELAMAHDIEGRAGDQQAASITGSNFHNGPLSIIITFGVWGAIAWLWFLLACFRALHSNRVYGDESLRSVNNFLFANFLARTIFFFGVFGEFRVDFPTFIGLIGLSLALNGGIRKPVYAPKFAKPIPIRTRPALRPATAMSRGI